jgi:hypothetical protein
MNTRVAFPFLVLPDDAVRVDRWMIGDPGEPLEDVASILENWDYARDLEVDSVVSIDWALCAEALQLPADQLQLRVGLLAGTGIGNLPRRHDRLYEKVVDAITSEVRLGSVIPGRTLSGRLRLSVQISLEGPTDSGSALSPRVRGARLWRSYADVLIEDGGDSRFPVETVSFSRYFKGQPQEAAPWYLHWQPNSLQADFSGSVRLFVNSDREEVASRFVEGDGPTLQAVLGDVMSQMAASVLDKNDCADLLAECEEGSVGRQIQNWLDIAFPGQEVSSIRAMRDRFPGRFHATLLAASDMGGSE